MLFLFLLLQVAGSLGADSKPVVRVKHGLLAGTWEVSENGRAYASFRGIPYAKPPVEEYRFKEPQDLQPWNGVWNATRFNSACIQYDPFPKDIVGSEDCLFLNVFTPDLSGDSPLPVMVYIHGGAFMYGSSFIYSAKSLMDRNMIVVTLNYRLGPIGFLSTGDEVIPGNNGLKDQAKALHWVQQNIAAFGGDPGSVMLFGCSAGGASVHYHYLSPLSEGTFARGFPLSGSAFAPWTFQMNPLHNAKTLVSKVGCTAASSYEIAECLKDRPADVIVRAQVDMLVWKDHMFTMFTPTAEAAGTPGAFLTEYPYQRSQAGRMHKVPMIASVTSEEGLYPAGVYQSDPSFLQELEEKWDSLASLIFEYDDTLPLSQRKSVANKIKNQYLDGKPVSQKTFGSLVQALSDRLFIADVGKMAQLHAAKSGQPTYVYKYSFRGQKSLTNIMTGTDDNYGASHADDLLHIFQLPGLFSTDPDDKKMTELLLDIVYTFTAHGVPKAGNVEWTPVTPGSATLDYLEISSPTDLKMKSDPDFGHRSFWDSLGFKEWKNFSPVKEEL